MPRNNFYFPVIETFESCLFKATFVSDVISVVVCTSHVADIFIALYNDNSDDASRFSLPSAHAHCTMDLIDFLVMCCNV